jgi:hypothetical protein
VRDDPDQRRVKAMRMISLSAIGVSVPGIQVGAFAYSAGSCAYQTKWPGRARPFRGAGVLRRRLMIGYCAKQ